MPPSETSEPQPLDPRIGTPIYALMSEFIDPRSNDLRRYPYTQERDLNAHATGVGGGSRSLRVCLYGSYEKVITRSIAGTRGPSGGRCTTGWMVRTENSRRL